MTDQNRTGMSWEDIRVFIALARHGSLSAVARVLSVSHATVARHIRSLETNLGERLVERRPNGYVLTPAGTRVLASANDMEAAAAVLARGGEDERPKGLVRVNAPPSLTQSFLAAKLARLSVDHPGLDIDLATDFRSVSLERRETDIALRFGRPEDGDVIAKPLVKIGFGFYATPDCCKRVRDGAHPVFVGFDEANAHLPEALWLSRSFPRARISFRANGQVVQAAAAKAGAGIALLPHFIGQSQEGLLACTLQLTPPPRELWLITRRQDREDFPMRTVTNFLARLFEEERELFEGSRENSADSAESRAIPSAAKPRAPGSAGNSTRPDRKRL